MPNWIFTFGLIVIFLSGYATRDLITKFYPARGHVDLFISAPDAEGNRTISLQLGSDGLGYVTLNPAQLNKIAETVKTH